eukprot:gnl/MRDRNA2_/MRDRNA2_139979_c0_seq1.p1 gnl/MRDRNA2_/MRDRNA2_139979_c0~~gnl/MRDRNA2_/MRDRNA2_139979_c0_seq1.p1  ORF type:complete len:269 (-),score=13.65 gnl/MRDRNA2_/MRDRNA2_139979_c0_seq1:190-996(-)
MYQPEVPPDAIPPNKYPPCFTVSKGLCAVAFTCVGVGFRLALPQCPIILLWISSIICGFAFVSWISLERQSLLKSRYGNHKEFGKLILSLPAVYLSSAVVTLGADICLPESPSQIGDYVWIVYWVGYVTGLHFTYIDNNSLLQSLGCKVPVPSLWSTLTRGELLALVSGISISLCLAIPVVKGLAAPFMLGRVLITYLIFFIAMAAYAAYAQRCLGHVRVHMHHYLICGVAWLPLTASCGLAPAICQGLLLGVYVEGVAVWGMDPIFW